MAVNCSGSSSFGRWYKKGIAVLEVSGRRCLHVPCVWELELTCRSRARTRWAVYSTTPLMLTVRLGVFVALLTMVTVFVKGPTRSVS